MPKQSYDVVVKRVFKRKINTKMQILKELVECYSF